MTCGRWLSALLLTLSHISCAAFRATTLAASLDARGFRRSDVGIGGGLVQGAPEEDDAVSQASNNLEAAQQEPLSTSAPVAPPVELDAVGEPHHSAADGISETSVAAPEVRHPEPPPSSTLSAEVPLIVETDYGGGDGEEEPVVAVQPEVAPEPLLSTSSAPSAETSLVGELHHSTDSGTRDPSVIEPKAALLEPPSSSLPSAEPPLVDGSEENISVSAYLEALHLEPLPAASLAPSAELPLAGGPHLDLATGIALKGWASKMKRGMIVKRATMEQMPKHLIAGLGPNALTFIDLSTKQLRLRMEEINAQRVRTARSASEAETFVRNIALSSLSSLAKADKQSISRFGASLDPLCRAVAAKGRILGKKGSGLLLDARRALREWLEEQDYQPLEHNDGAASDAPFDTVAACGFVAKSLRDISKNSKARSNIIDLASRMSVASWRGVSRLMRREALGSRGESRVKNQLALAGIERGDYWVEDELRTMQFELFGRAYFSTPDFVFKRGLLVNGRYLVRWIDSKGSCYLPGFDYPDKVSKLRKQLTKYAEVFGPGLVIWQSNFSLGVTEGLPSLFCDAWAPSVQ